MSNKRNRITKAQTNKLTDHAKFTQAEWYDFNRTTGKIVKTTKIELGSMHALEKDPTTLLNPDSDHRRLLVVMSSLRSDWLTALEITKFFNDKHTTTKRAEAISARLSELFTLGLVERHKKHGNKGIAVYILSPGVNEIVDDGRALYKRAKARQREIKELIKNGQMVKTAQKA